MLSMTNYARGSHALTLSGKRGYLSPPDKEYHVSPCDSYVNRMVRFVMRITTWANQYTAHKASWLHALLAVFFILGPHSPCFVAKKSITKSGFSCLLIWLQSTQGSSKYPLVLFPLSHDMLSSHFWFPHFFPTLRCFFWSKCRTYWPSTQRQSFKRSRSNIWLW